LRTKVSVTPKIEQVGGAPGSDPIHDWTPDNGPAHYGNVSDLKTGEKAVSVSGKPATATGSSATWAGSSPSVTPPRKIVSITALS